MTIIEFPLGYFYIISQLNGLVLDVADIETAGPGSKIVTAVKKEKSPERDSQLWMHQDGFLTNKATGLVLDVDKAGTFRAIFTGEEHLFLDQMKETDEAHDQRFGYDGHYIYTLSDSNVVVDIRKSEMEAGARAIVYKRKDGAEDGEEQHANQGWSIELGDPPKVVDPEEEEDGKGERLQAWFGNWFGWGDRKKDVLKEEELDDAHTKIYKEKKSHASHQLLAGAVAYQAVRIWEKKQEEKGEEVNHGTLKKIIASIAAAELVKVIEERGGQDDDEDDDDDKKQEKKGMMESMATSAAMNLIESKYGLK